MLLFDTFYDVFDIASISELVDKHPFPTSELGELSKVVSVFFLQLAVLILKLFEASLEVISFLF